MATESLSRVLFWILMGLVLAMRVYFAIRVRQAGERLLPDREAVRREGLGMFIARTALFFLLLAWLVLYTWNPPWLGVLAIPLPPWLRGAGFGLGLASVVFWTWVQAVLGTHWSAQLQLREEHHLVTAGPYARIRHPLYTAMFGFGLGLALVSSNWVFVGLALLIVAGTAARVPREEHMLVEEFGEEYRAYVRRTGRFFPRLS